MENRPSKIITRKSIDLEISDSTGELELKRLNTLLSANELIAKEKAIYCSDRERFEANLIKNPLTSETAFAYFGIMLGALPPAAIFSRFFLNPNFGSGDGSWILAILLLINIVSAITGFYSGKLIGKMVQQAEKKSWAKMILLLPLFGALWGIISGGAGGFMFFIFGAFFGAFVGGLVGGIALPIFGIFHRLCKKGDLIERNQFLPIAFGVTLTICAFILGL